MKIQGALWLMMLVMVGACREQRVKQVTSTRAVVESDGKVRCFASDDERFRNARPSPVKAGYVPEQWLAKPATEFRLLNYGIAGGAGEVWVSTATGMVVDNVNRWIKGQFGGVEMSQNQVNQLKKVSLAGGEGVWVETEGRYAPGMGAAPREGYALAGVVAKVNGQIITVKMVGPKEVVMAEKQELEKFVSQLALQP